jgi:hypothetical protein
LPRNLWPLALKGTIAFLVGLAIWAGLAQPYARVLAGASQLILRVTERPDVSTITTNGTLLVVARSDMRVSRTSGRFAVESRDLTFNIILLITLFGASRRALSDKNVFGFAAAAASLALIHIVAAVAYVKAYYAAIATAPLSYLGMFAARFWEAAPFFYSVVGAYGFAVALWWLLRPTSEAQPARTKRRGRLQPARQATHVNAVIPPPQSN